jgi:hypothetical protein
MIGYKVIGEDMKSCSSKPVKYIIDEWVFPHAGDGPLAVFNTWKNAAVFTRNLDGFGYDLQIYKCKYTPIRLFPDRLWHYNNDNIINYMFACDFPIGTRIASSVMLIKKSRQPEKDTWMRRRQ